LTPTRPLRELVLASAGSGKTYYLSSRVIGLLASGAEVEDVFASTFTRKAAGEILDRVLTSLARASIGAQAAKKLAVDASLDPSHPLPVDPAFWADVLRHVTRRLHRLNVGTLDAFFMRAAAAFGRELGLPAGWRIPDPSAAKRLHSRALLRLMDEMDAAQLLDLLGLISGGEVKRSVHDHLARLMNRLVEIEEGLDSGTTDPWSAFQDISASEPTRAERLLLVERLCDLPVPLTAKGAKRTNWVRAIEQISDALDRGAWEELIRSTLCQRVAAGAPSFDRAEIEEPMRALIEELLEVARGPLRRRLARQARGLGSLTEQYLRVYRTLQREEGLFGFDDVTRLIAASDHFGAGSDLYYRLDARIRHILLDEFQDTSRPQWEALSPIVQEVLSDTDRAAVIVADPKQSIYGWRGAEPRFVQAIGERYRLDGRSLAMSWRSSQVVLDFVNRVFLPIERNPVIADDEACALAAKEWVRDFRPHSAHRSLPGFATLEVGPRDEGRGGTRPLLFRRAAERAAEIREVCPSFSIGILARTNATVARLFMELREIGVSVSQEGGNPLTDVGAVEAIISLLLMADHPGHTIARYHVARSPLGRIVGLEEWRDDRAAAALSSRLRRRLLEDGYGSTLSKLIRRLASRCDRREVRRLGQLAELAYRYDARATLRPADFVRLIEAERVQDRTGADVRVMTIHQAKGLEFDIVLLPELDAPIFRGGGTAPVLPYRRDPAGRITGVYPAGDAALRRLFPELEAVFLQTRSAVMRDALSTLYVALTRARHAVHLIIAPEGGSGGESPITPARLLREALRDPGTPLQTASEGAVLHEEGDRSWFTRPAAIAFPDAVAQRGASQEVQAVVTPIEVVVQPRTRMLPRERPSRLQVSGPLDVREILRLDNAPALARGTLMHAWLERICWIEDAVPPEEHLRAIALECAPGMGEGAVTSALADFFGFLRAPGVRALLRRDRYPAGSIVEREFPFLHRRGETMIEGVIDRLVLVPGESGFTAGEVIDYKTDRVSGSTQERRLARKYAPQLEVYREVIGEMFGIPSERCVATLLFLEADHFAPVGTNSSALSFPLPA